MSLEKELSVQDIMMAYNKLPPEQKDILDKQANALIKAMRERTKGKTVGPKFGRYCAIELLARLGLFCTKEDICRLD